MKRMIVHGEKDLLQIAIVDEGRLIEFYMEKSENAGQLAGSIYKGRIVNVLPGMQAAFVDIGLAKNAFLYLDDVLHPHLERQPSIKPSIEQLLKVGQDIVVQVMKEPLGSKGARVTTHFSLPGRFLVYMPYADYVGVSKKLSGEYERGRMRSVGESIRGPGEGVILRTAAEGESNESLKADVQFLRGLWERIEAISSTVSSPAVIHQEAALVHRLVRDLLTSEMDEVWIDNEDSYKKTKNIMQQMAPSMISRLRLYEQRGSVSLFQQYRINEQLHEAFERKVRLASGGYLVIDRTEALTVIDVNTGKFVGTSDLEDTVFRNNMEAVDQLARLIRLRDIGGIIIIDFIDMELAEHRDQIIQRLELLMRQDRTRCQIVGWTRLGLLELTRRKVREHSFERFFELNSSMKGRGRT